MTTSIHTHQQQWMPPERPEWVQRINDEGRCMNIRSVVPLDERSLIEAAVRSTGLSDFGLDEWREPFAIFLKALDDEAELNLLGRLRTRSEILLLLEARLQIEEAYKRHPEIDEEQITQPLIIVGQGRSGTTYLQAVLGAHPDNGVLMHWEQMFPCPPPEAATYATDVRIEKAAKLIGQWNRVTPTLPAIYDFSADVPFEDCCIMAIDFMSPSWLGMQGQIPSYDAWFFQQDLEATFRYHQRILKLLQWRNPRTRWVLKDPMHLDRFVPILKVYPDACFIWPHRDPVWALASMVDAMGTLQWGRSDEPFRGGSLDFVTNPHVVANRLNAVIDAIDAGVVPERQLLNLQFGDLVSKPIESVTTIYDYFGIPLSSEAVNAMQHFVDTHPRDARPRHRFNPGTPEAADVARDAFARYQQRFGVTTE